MNEIIKYLFNFRKLVDLAKSIYINLAINSHASGIAVARPNGFEIDFVRNPISGSAAWFFVIIFEFIFTPIFEIKIHEKKSLTQKKIHFQRPIFKNRNIRSSNKSHFHVRKGGLVVRWPRQRGS